MPDTETEDVEEKVDELEDKVEQLEEQSQGRNQLEIKAYDLSIQASSEDTDMRELLSMCSSEMEDLTQRALVGQYQELEQQDLFQQMFGGGD